MQDFTNSNKIKENKYKILRMSLLLGSDDNRQETIINFEDAARDIDAMNDEIYLNDLEKKFYDTFKLEDEEKKLADLVDYIGGRVEQRIYLLTDFSNVTGYDLTDLPPIKYYDKLDDYKERLSYIREYLSNVDEISKLTKEIDNCDNKLKEAYLSKATSEENNKKSEEMLLNKFKNIIKNVDELREVTEENIDDVLIKVSSATEESKKSLEIFTKSFMTLTNAGISREEEQEYKSYVENAKDIYYSNKEVEFFLRIYKLLFVREYEYNMLIVKRDNINNILAERMDLRKNLHINNDDLLENLYDLLDRQYQDISRQKNNVHDIERLTMEIDTKKERVNELEIDNQKVEILSLLREFGVIDTYTEEELPSDSIEDIKSNVEVVSDEKVEKEDEENKEDEINEIKTVQNNATPSIFDIELPRLDNTNNKIDNTESSSIEDSVKSEELEEVKDNQIINVEDFNNIDIDLVQSKANKVMKRVGEMLGIKVNDTEIVSVSNEDSKVEESNSTTVTESNDKTVDENPLFNNNIESEVADSSNEQEVDNNFWFPSETPDALNELPDLEVTQNDNFFTNNNLSDLKFPDLNINFDNNDTEAK